MPFLSFPSYSVLLHYLLYFTISASFFNRIISSYSSSPKYFTFLHSFMFCRWLATEFFTKLSPKCSLINLFLKTEFIYWLIFVEGATLRLLDRFFEVGLRVPLKDSIMLGFFMWLSCLSQSVETDLHLGEDIDVLILNFLCSLISFLM